jgi:hypothetical protein
MLLTLYPLTVGVWCRGRDVRGVGTPAHRGPPCTLTYEQRSDPPLNPQGGYQHAADQVDRATGF